ncbi:MAG: V-type ATP synthase subunit D [Oscillospiraceae bacterium]|nr:V-type ATP synthase subunit D [Oscillospiraceae bacterium]
MASITVNPTRMELTRLKARLKTAIRGHKLLKGKRDELMRRFLDNVRHNRELRTKVEESLMKARASFAVASAVMSPEMLEQALLYPKQKVNLEVRHQNIMSVDVPVYEFKTLNHDPSDLYPYGFSMTSGELDIAIETLATVFQDMLELAQVEKTSQLLAEEIEKTRRRVNALEYVLIPNMQENIRYISMKLEENERGNIKRLMKVKEMILAQAWEEQKARMEQAIETQRSQDRSE